MSLDGLALAIGVSRYRHLPQLPEVQDAQDVAAALADPSLCAYPPEEVITLLEEEATRAAIVGALERLALRATPSSTVFVYFSGHGSHAADRETSYLVPVDGDDASDEALARSAIAGSELTERLRAIPARRLTVVLDCCRAAGAAEPKDVRRRLHAGLSASVLGRLGLGLGRAVLAASRSDGPAYVVPGSRNGIFTRHLLEGLRGGAVGVGGVVRVCDLFHYVQERVTAAHPAQRPVFKAELEENYPLALHLGGATPILALPRREDGFVHDAFVSYRRDDPDDRLWTEKTLVPALESRGLRLCLEHRDFRLGHTRIDEMERAVENSRYTIGVFSPAYLDGAFEGFKEMLAAHESIEGRRPRFLPLIHRSCALRRLRHRMTTVLDLSDPTEVEAGLQRLALALVEPPHPPLA